MIANDLKNVGPTAYLFEVFSKDLRSISNKFKMLYKLS